MQSALVEMEIEVSSLTADAVNEVANEVGATAEQTAAYLLTEGFSNLQARRF